MTLKNTFPLRAKLLLVFLVIMTLVGAMSSVHILNARDADGITAIIVERHIPRLEALQELRSLTAEIRVYIITLELGPNRSDSTTSVREMASTLEAMQGQEATYKKTLESASSTAQRDYLARITGLRASLERTMGDFSTLRQQRARPEQLTMKAQELKVVQTTLADTITEGVNYETDQLNKAEAQLAVKTRNIARSTVAFAALVIVISLILGWVTSGFIVRNLKRLKLGAYRLAAGDFSQTIEVTSRDEIGELARAFNEMSLRLKYSYGRLALEKTRDEILLDSIGDGLIAIDGAGRVVLANRVARSLLELGGEATLVGKKVHTTFELTDADNRTLTQEAWPSTRTLHDGKPAVGVFELLRRDHRRVVISISSNPVVVDGEVAGAILVIRNITKEREVDRMKTEFISLASHQLRTPLSAIKWFSEMLLNGDAGNLKPEQRQFTENIAESTERMIDLVNSLLNISRIESGRIIIDPQLVDLHELVANIVKDLKAKTAVKGQELRISVHQDLPKIQLDPRLISQVYLNLLTNAIKYTPKHGEITVLVSQRDDQVVSQVTDSGYGIPKAQQGRVFQKFFRADNVSKMEPDGTGLGLYLVKAIIESSGGKIWFESEEGKGTTFWFTLPMSGMKRKAGEVALDTT